jgi:hypothetical protein
MIPLKEPIFKELQAEDPDVAPTEVESMCVNCGENVSHLSYLLSLTEFLYSQIFPRNQLLKYCL